MNRNNIAFFKSKLKLQLDYIHRSCKLFDSGYDDEAYRIATHIRAIVHDTNNSTSIIKNLGKESIKLYSLIKPITARPTAYINIGSMGICANGLDIVPKHRAPTYHESACEMQFHEWKSQIISIYADTEITRVGVILGAANKDGGAHADPKYKKDYRAIVEGLGICNISDPGEEKWTQIKGLEKIAIRDIAFEILNSKELINI
jgi:hypothetical protein